MKTSRPRSYDADIIVIGAGSAGLVSAYIASVLKAKVILVESGSMGGDCLNTGCVPSKALIAAARRAHHARESGAFGIDAEGVTVDFARVMSHVRSAIESIEPNDSVARYTRLGVQCTQGQARLIDPWTVAVDGSRFRGRNIVIAAGADPSVPPVPGLERTPYLTSETLWQLDQLPRRMAVLGGGPIGCELSQAFARLGSSVSLFEMKDRLVVTEDADIGELLQHQFEQEGISVHTRTQVKSVSAGTLHYVENGETRQSHFDALLIATGRRARVNGYGLEELGVEIVNGRIGVNPFLQTNYSHIFACGDVTGPYQFTHAASHQAWHCTVNALFRPLKRFRINYDHLPFTIYTEPEIARVGLNETEATSRGVAFETTLFEIADLDRAVTEGERAGFVKILTAPRSDRILGVSIACAHAGELISTATLAMKHQIGLNKLLATIMPYPAWTEALKRTSGAWKQAHAPQWVFPWLERFHRFRRGSK